jgi:plastocyanin
VSGPIRAALALLLAVAALAPGAALARLSAKATAVTVVATEHGLKLSRKKVPAGAVVFRFRNAGTRAHDLEVAGKKTAAVKPGGKATLRVTLAKPGKVALASTVGGKLKGVLDVQRVTTVDVTEYEFGFDLSRTTVPAGKVVFVMRNSGGIVHNFDLIDGGVGPFLTPGQTATMTVTLKPGSYIYVCSVKYHAAQGMQGTLTVT